MLKTQEVLSFHISELHMQGHPENFTPAGMEKFSESSRDVQADSTYTVTA